MKQVLFLIFFVTSGVVQAEIENITSNFLYLFRNSGDFRAKMSCTSFYAKDNRNKKTFEYTAAHCLERPTPFKENDPFISYTTPESVGHVTKFPWWGDEVYTVYEAKKYSKKYKLYPDRGEVLQGKDIVRYSTSSHTKAILNIEYKPPKIGDILYSVSFPDGFGPSKLTCEVIGFTLTPISDRNNSKIQLSFVCDPIDVIGRDFSTGSSGAPLFNDQGKVFGVLHRGYSRQYGGYLATSFWDLSDSIVKIENIITGSSIDNDVRHAELCFNSLGEIINNLISIETSDRLGRNKYYKFENRSFIDSKTDKLECENL